MTELKKLIVGLAETFGVTLVPTRLQIYVGVLGDLPLEDVKRAISAILRDPEIKFFPLPAVIREKVCGGMPLMAAAQELLARCIYAAGKFGYYDSEGAHQYLGDLVWNALPGPTGWREWCSAGDANAIDPGIARAQLRERLLSQLRQNTTESRIQLPPPGRVQQRGFVPFEAGDETPKPKAVEPIREQLRVVSGRDRAAGEKTDE